MNTIGAHHHIAGLHRIVDGANSRAGENLPYARDTPVAISVQSITGELWERRSVGMQLAEPRGGLT